MNFGEALQLLKDGKKVAREKWNGKNMFIYFVKGSTFTANRPPISDFLPTGAQVTYRSHIDMKTADDEFVPWIASQSDLIEEDWYEVD